MQDILERAARTRLVIFDVDGVLTDGSLYLATTARSTRRSTRVTDMAW